MAGPRTGPKVMFAQNQTPLTMAAGLRAEAALQAMPASFTSCPPLIPIVREDCRPTKCDPGSPTTRAASRKTMGRCPRYINYSNFNLHSHDAIGLALPSGLARFAKTMPTLAEVQKTLPFDKPNILREHVYLTHGGLLDILFISPA